MITKQKYLEEVELTAGRLAKSGDDYWQDAQTLHFYTAPTTTFSVLIQSNPAQGYQQLSPCSISLAIEVWSDGHGTHCQPVCID